MGKKPEHEQVGMRIWKPTFGWEVMDALITEDLSAVLTCGLGLLGPVACAQLLVEVKTFRTGKIKSLTFGATVEHSAIIWVTEESFAGTFEIGTSLHLFGFSFEWVNEGRW